jgi:hypothetical protein
MAFTPSALSILFPGVAGDVVTLGDALDHDWETDARTYSFWFKMGSALRTLMGKRDSFSTQGFWIYMDSGRIGFEIREPAFLRALKIQNNTGPLVGDSAWHHGAIVVVPPAASATAKIYIDGSLYAHTAFTGNLQSGDVTVNNDPMIFGHHQLIAGGPSPMTGNLDELAFYNAALTQAQITALALGPNNLAQLDSWANNIGWFRMGDDDTFPTIADNGNGTSNDGTMVGGLLVGDIVSDAPAASDFLQSAVAPADVAPSAQKEDDHSQAFAFELESHVLDTTAPVVDNFVPALGTPITSHQPIQFDVTDNSGQFRRVIVHAVFADGVTEVVHDGDQFRGYYLTDSSRVLIAGGLRYTALRAGGWPSAPTFNIFAIDASGNEAA